jgi:hypothetical protein
MKGLLRQAAKRKLANEVGRARFAGVLPCVGTTPELGKVAVLLPWVGGKEVWWLVGEPASLRSNPASGKGGGAKQDDPTTKKA